MSDQTRTIICPRCEGSGAIWCYDIDGVSHPKSRYGSCSPLGWQGRYHSTTDHSCTCDVCEGTGRIHVLSALPNWPLSDPVALKRAQVWRWGWTGGEE